MTATRAGSIPGITCAAVASATSALQMRPAEGAEETHTSDPNFAAAS